MDAFKKLIELENMGISQTVLARYCHCHKATINRLVNGEAQPTEKMLYLIEVGLNKFYNDIKEKMGEE